VHGKHYVKFGGEARRSNNVEDDPTTPSERSDSPLRPTGLPGVAASGNGLASLMVGFPTTFTLLVTQVLDRRSWYYAAFVQDDWQAHKNLTLNIGLRWETDTPIRDANNRMNSFDLHAINPVSGTPGVVKFAGLNGWPETPYAWDWNNFGPRFGFAWKPFGSTSTVVRGGFGIFFAALRSAAPNSVAGLQPVGVAVLAR
jgi:outer membrane receptor protein involved in Fe transport